MVTTVQDLRSKLAECNCDGEVWVAKDAEGNDFHAVFDVRVRKLNGPSDPTLRSWMLRFSNSPDALSYICLCTHFQHRRFYQTDHAVTVSQLLEMLKGMEDHLPVAIKTHRLGIDTFAEIHYVDNFIDKERPPYQANAVRIFPIN